MSDVEYIKWIDSASLSGGGWRSKDEVYELEPLTIETYGLVVNEEDTYVTIVHSDARHGGFHGELCIPKVAILERKKLYAENTLSGIWDNAG